MNQVMIFKIGKIKWWIYAFYQMVLEQDIKGNLQNEYTLNRQYSNKRKCYGLLKLSAFFSNIIKFQFQCFFSLTTKENSNHYISIYVLTNKLELMKHIYMPLAPKKAFSNFFYSIRIWCCKSINHIEREDNQKKKG